MILFSPLWYRNRSTPCPIPPSWKRNEVQPEKCWANSSAVFKSFSPTRVIMKSVRKSNISTNLRNISWSPIPPKPLLTKKKVLSFPSYNRVSRNVRIPKNYSKSIIKRRKPVRRNWRNGRWSLQIANTREY